MSFCTAINCMDGRVQAQVTNYMRRRFATLYVDMITEPGPVRILAEGKERHVIGSILNRVETSLRKHQSRGVAIVAHEDCAGNPLPRDEQTDQLEAAVAFLKKHYPNTPIIALWADLAGDVEELPEPRA